MNSSVKQSNGEINNIFSQAIAELKRSNVDKRHPYRTFSLATVNKSDKTPEVRTVVKRQFDSNYNILFYSDSRSEKIFEMQEHAYATVLFYHPRKKLQLRIKCKVELPGTRTKLFREHKAIVEKMASRADYQSKLYPGTPVGLDEKILYGSKLHFSLVLLKPYELDILKLGRKAHARFLYTNNGKSWIGQRLVP